MHNAKCSDSRGVLHFPLSRKHILGHCAQRVSHVMAWHQSASEHGKGKGSGTSRAHEESDAVGQVMGLRCCGGVHSTSRPPQKDFSFPAVAID